MRMNGALTLLLFLLLSAVQSPAAGASPAGAVPSPEGASLVHGIHIQVSAEGGTHIARAFYEGGTPVAGGDITITAPDSGEAWQTGRTDPAGRFAFLPDGQGTWTIQVDDGRGHRARTTVQVRAEQTAALPETETPLQGVVAGSHSHEHADEATHSHEHAEEATHSHEHAEEAQPFSSPRTDAGGTLTHPQGEADHGEGRVWQLLTGLGLIAGITGTAYGYTARRKGADTQ